MAQPGNLLKNKVFIRSSNVFTPYGLGVKPCREQLAAGTSAIGPVHREDIRLKNFYAAEIPPHIFEETTRFLQGKDLTRLEKLMIATITGLDREEKPFSDPGTVFVFSTTKGNIDRLSTDHCRVLLPDMAAKVSSWFGNSNPPAVVSNACISGVSAILHAVNLLEYGGAENAVVCGADILSEFTVAGFNSLNALSPFPCKPFDMNRQGLSPGEGCGVLVLSKKRPGQTTAVRIAGGASSNDANHISGPSRTGEGLHLAIEKAIRLSGISKSEVSFINSHGTATVYNDESESLAITLSGLQEVPVHSMKGYLGHTFGAAGVIETVMAADSIANNAMAASAGYETHGVSVPVNVVKTNLNGNFNHCLKTASGFGGCNAALILSKDE